MGQPTKKAIEKLKLEKRSAKAAKKRKENTRSKIVRFLIVCEGEETEPNYFRALIKDKYSAVREVEIKGKGMSTCSLVRQALQTKGQLEKDRGLAFDYVWVVFDKDDFHDFNDAILLAHQKALKCAWSNEAFELWYYLHFQFLSSGINRYDYIEKIQNEIRKHPNFKNFEYKKNDPNFYNILKSLGNESLAKQYASKLRQQFIGNSDFKNQKPCTTVDLLVEELENPEKLLIKQ